MSHCNHQQKPRGRRTKDVIKESKHTMRRIRQIIKGNITKASKKQRIYKTVRKQQN